jgi:hypothetical protein
MLYQRTLRGPAIGRLAALGFLGLACTARAATIDGLAVEVTNTSEPVLCAEKDNVSINFSSPRVRSFRVEATHPAYIGTMRQDRRAPDWTACEDISAETSDHPHPTMTTLYEDTEIRVTGLSYTHFWRPSDITVQVGDRIERGIHMMQILKRHQDRLEEVLAFYPGDGYWRIRPLPPAHLERSAYGSSFLVGPVEMDARPVVNLEGVAFDPKTMTFTLAFETGGSATVALEELTEERLGLEVTFDRVIADRPFATLRSMYVTESSADVARIAAREENARSWREEPIMNFTRARATDVWMGRLVPSRHNTSAPDMTFSRFREAPASSR